MESNLGGAVLEYLPSVSQQLVSLGATDFLSSESDTTIKLSGEAATQKIVGSNANVKTVPSAMEAPLRTIKTEPLRVHFPYWQPLGFGASALMIATGFMVNSIIAITSGIAILITTITAILETRG